MKRLLLVVVSLVTPFSAIAAQTTRVDSASVIETGGVGLVSLVPDHAVITITVSVRDSSAARAAQRNATILRALVDSLNAFKQAPESVTVVGLAVRPATDRVGSQLLGYDAAADVHYTLRDLARVGAILDVALRAGATDVQDIQYRSDREDAARRDALAIAYASAQSDAQALARAAGVTLGPLLRMTTVERGNFISLAEERWQAVAVVPREIRVKAQVVASYQMVRPR